MGRYLNTLFWRSNLSELICFSSVYIFQEDDGVAAVEGIVQKIFAKEGDEVKRGDIVVQINVMKMLFDIVAQKDGIISAVCFQEGDRVSKGELLFELKD